MASSTPPTPPNTLFTLPILSLSPIPNALPSGSLTCTVVTTLSLSHPATKIYTLTFHSSPDNRLTTPFCQALLLALDILEFGDYEPGVIVTTSAIGKFYSNGLDLEHAKGTEGFWGDSFFGLLGRLLTYPMPTIALLNGHAFAGGIMLALYHDYRILNPSKGFLCLNELHLGVPLKPAMSSIFREKLSPQTYRSMVLEAKRFGGKEALEAGIVDVLGGSEELEAFVGERELGRAARRGGSGEAVYASLKREMYKETLACIAGLGEEVKDEKRAKNVEEKRVVKGKRRVREWEKNAVKAKL